MCHKSKRFLSLLLCGALLFSLSAFHTHADALGLDKECTNPNGHKFIQVEETNPASVGYTPECPGATVIYQLKCEYCSAERGYYGGGHAWSGWTNNADGTRSRTCTQCGQQQSENVGGPSHTHTMETVTVPATCTQDGYTYERCTKRDYEGPKTVIPATGHKAVDDDDCRTPPHCSVCGELLWDGKTYPAVHNFSGPYEYDENGHWRHCVNPGCSAVSPVSRHRTTGGVGDCTKGEVCSECGVTVSMGRGHNFENAKVGITTAAGHYLICANPGCGQTQFFAHSFSAGKCAVCGVADPNYKPGQEQSKQEEQTPEEKKEPEAPAEQGAQGAQKAPEAQVSQGEQKAPETQAAPAAPEAQETQTAQAAQASQTAQAPQVAQGNTPVVDKKFSDVSANAWYAGNVQRVVEAGLMNGVSDSSFSPNTNVNRAMLVTILYRLADQPGPGMGNFIDVKESAYYADAVSWAATTGIVTGFKDHSFQPKQDITRQELATILYRYAKWMGYPMDGADDLSAFADRGQIASWAYEAMAWANGAGILNGRGGNELAPTATATRAEVATMMVRLMDLMGAQ